MFQNIILLIDTLTELNDTLTADFLLSDYNFIFVSISKHSKLNFTNFAHKLKIDEN